MLSITGFGSLRKRGARRCATEFQEDQNVPLADLRLLIQMLTGLVPVELATADLDGDGQVTLADVRALVQILLSPV